MRRRASFDVDVFHGVSTGLPTVDKKI